MLMNFRRTALAVIGLLAPALSLTAQIAAPSVGNLTIEEAVARALQKNFSLEVGRFNPEIAREAIDVARGTYLPELSVTASHGTARTAQNGLVAGTKLETGDVRIGVTQRFYTGTTATVSTKTDRADSSLNPTVNPAYNADLTVSVRQQLLAGADVEVNRASLDRARLGFDRANLVFKSSVLDVIKSTENAYYALAFAREQLEVRRFSLALAERLLDEAKTRRRTGVATDLDVLQADVGVANARRGVLLANQVARDNEEALLALISQFELDGQLGAVSLPASAMMIPTFASSYDAAKRNQPDLQAAAATLDQLRIDSKVAKSNQKGDLSVGAAVGFNSFAAGNTSGAYSGAFDRDKSSWQIDIAYKLPWGQVGNKARNRQALAAVSQQEVAIRSLEQGIEAQVRSAVRAVETNTESVQISTQARELSEKQYELEKARFDAGLSTSRRVLEAQNDLETARVNELSSRVALRNSYASLHRIEGSSLQRYGVNLP